MKKFVIFFCTYQKDRLEKVLQTMILTQEVEFKKVALACLAEIEVRHLLKALETEAEGVIVFSCPNEDCVYITGSPHARRHLKYGQKILQEIGLDEVRFSYWEGNKSTLAHTAERLNQWLNKLL